MSSLSARLLLSVSLLLLFFFGATIVVLDIAFREAGEQAQEDILDGQLMALLAAAEPNIYGELEMPVALPEPRFSNLDSGLYGQLRDDSDAPVWKSPSALGLQLPYGEPPVFGTHKFSRVVLEDGTPLMALSLAVEWELPNGDLKPYTFSVAESLDSFYSQLARFRRQLFGWFAAVALFMLFAISLVMRSVLKPLRQIEGEFSDVEKGRRQELSDGFPTELTGVARNMNLLIGSERARSERYRNTLDNLAHSLKTPLAAIRAVLSEQQQSTDGSRRIEAQIERMNDIVRYQLRKPATLASDSLGVVPICSQLPLTGNMHRLTLEGGDLVNRPSQGDQVFQHQSFRKARHVRLQIGPIRRCDTHGRHLDLRRPTTFLHAPASAFANSYTSDRRYGTVHNDLSRLGHGGDISRLRSWAPKGAVRGVAGSPLDILPSRREVVIIVVEALAEAGVTLERGCPQQNRR